MGRLAVALSSQADVAYPKLPSATNDLRTKDEVKIFCEYLKEHQAVSFRGIAERNAEKLAQYRRIAGPDFRVLNWIISTNGASDVPTDNAIPKAGNSRKGRWFTRIKISNTVTRYNDACFVRWRHWQTSGDGPSSRAGMV